MKNKTPYIVTAIIFALFNVVAFAIPSDKTATFWVAYAFSVVAFAVQVFVWWKAFGQKGNLKSKFLGFPVLNIAVTYLAFQLVAFLIFKFIPFAPTWSAILVCALILGISSVCMISGNVGANVVAEIDEKISVKRQFIKSLQIEVEMLAESEKDENVKQRLLEFAKKIRLSDPISDNSVSEIEKELSAKVNSLNNADDRLSALNEAEQLLIKRNKMVKALKS